MTGNPHLILSRFFVLRSKQVALMDNKVILESNLKTGLENESDEELFLFMAAGNDQEKDLAYSEFHNRYSRYIYKICYQWGINQGLYLDNVEDLFVDSCYRIYELSDKYQVSKIDDPENPGNRTKAWVGKIISHYLIDCYRNDKTTTLDFLNIGNIDLLPERESDPPSKNTKLIEEAIETLSEKDQEIVRAYVNAKDPRRFNARGEQGTTKDLAKNLGMTPSAVRQRFCRAKAKIKEYTQNKIN